MPMLVGLRAIPKDLSNVGFYFFLFFSPPFFSSLCLENKDVFFFLLL